ALGLGMVSRVMEPASFRDDVLAVAAEVAGTAPIAARLTKRALQLGHASIETALEWEALAQPVTLATADLLEGIAAAQEKRAPVFEGR
ncbi:enoyl-CoA hydratase/isomerase family protein, partial [Nocardioides sp. GCM10030258]